MDRSKCPICGLGKLTKKVSDEVFEYKGNEVVVPRYTTYVCNVCGESIVDNKSLKKSSKILKDFQRKVDGFLSGEEIKRIRRKLGLTQEEMSQILGGGKKAFARYETGEVSQSMAMDNLLRVLDYVIDRVPDVITYLRQIRRLSNPAEEIKVIYLDKVRYKYKIHKGYKSTTEEEVNFEAKQQDSLCA